MLVFWQKWLCLGNREMYSAKVVEFGKGGRFRGKGVVFGQSCCFGAKLLYSVKVAVLELKWLY